MIRLVIVIVAVIALCAGTYYALDVVYRLGRDKALVEQATVDAEAYRTIIREIQNGTLDLDNPKSVDCFLYELAEDKANAESDECRALRRNRTNEEGPR